MAFPFHVLGLFFLLIVTRLTAAVLRNITIDDEYGDEKTKALPDYAPLGNWAQGKECHGCLTLDQSQAFGGTWHDSTHHPGEPPRTITFKFDGTAIYVYCILANNVKPGVDTLANYTFTIDGDLVGNFTHIPDNTTTFRYNALVYSNNSVPSGLHTLSLISNPHTKPVLILFDYAHYTVDLEDVADADLTAPAAASITPPPDNTRSNTQRVAEIVAGILGGISVIGLGLIMYLLRHRFRLKKANQTAEDGLRMSRPQRPTVHTHRATNPPPPPSSPGLGAITPFPLRFDPEPPRSEKSSRRGTDAIRSDSELTPSTTTGSNSSRPSARRQVSFGNHQPRSGEHRHRRRRRQEQESSSGRSGESSQTSTSHSDGRESDSRTHTRSRHRRRGSEILMSPMSSRDRSASAEGSPSRRRPPEGGMTSSRLRPLPTPEEQEAPSNRRQRLAPQSDATSSPASRRTNTATSELESLRLAVHDLREQQQIMLSALQPHVPPPSYDQPPP